MASYFLGKTIDPDTGNSYLKIEGERYSYRRIRGYYSYQFAKRNEAVNKKYCQGLTAKTLVDLAKEIIKRHPTKRCLAKERAEHIRILNEGIQCWNQWRMDNPEVRPILYDLNVKPPKLHLRNLKKINFSNANLIKANLQEVDLTKANFHEANLGGANLSRATLIDANFCRTDLYKTNLSGADLTGANLQGAQIAETNFDRSGDKQTQIVNCKVYGSSAWGIKNLDKAKQEKIRIIYTDGIHEEPYLDVDDLTVAQFLYFVLNNKNLTRLFTATGSSLVLILGRFEEKGKEILTQIRKDLQSKAGNKKYIPIIFDFPIQKTQGYTETVTLLAGLSKFIIADLTNPRSLPQELQAILTTFRTPLIPIIRSASHGTSRDVYSMFKDFSKFEWVHRVISYSSKRQLSAHFEKLIDRAETFHKKIFPKTKTKSSTISITKLK